MHIFCSDRSWFMRIYWKKNLETLRFWGVLGKNLMIFEVLYNKNVSLRAVQWQGVSTRWKIAKNCSTQLRFVEQCVAIFHLEQTPVPLHGSSWNICILSIHRLLFFNVMPDFTFRTYTGADLAFFQGGGLSQRRCGASSPSREAAMSEKKNTLIKCASA